MKIINEKFVIIVLIVMLAAMYGHLVVLSFEFIDEKSEVKQKDIFSLAYAEEQYKIPKWVKGIAAFWIEGKISDREFGEAITFLIEQGIIKIDSVAISEPIQDPLSGERKRLYELELNQKDDRISILEKELKDTGLDNSHLLNSIMEKENTVVNMQKLYDQVKIDFNQYKEDYPLKIGNIGGKLVVDYIKELEDRIAELEQ